MLVPKIIDADHLKDCPGCYDELIEVVIVSDDDSHEYLIPKALEEEFTTLNKQCYEVNDGDGEIDDNFDPCFSISNRFSMYKLEGQSPQLYAKVGYEKEL